MKYKMKFRTHIKVAKPDMNLLKAQKVLFAFSFLAI